MRSLKVSAAAIGLVLGMTSASHAQNAIPGGWSSQVGYHAVGASGQGGYGTSYYGWNSGAMGGVVVGQGYGQYTSRSGYTPQPARTVNNLGPLGAAIGRTTRPRRSR